VPMLRRSLTWTRVVMRRAFVRSSRAEDRSRWRLSIDAAPLAAADFNLESGWASAPTLAIVPRCL